MRTWKPVLLLLTVSAAAWAPATASASFQHVVSSGETLSSVAAADGLSVSQLAAANGLSPSSQLVAGSSLSIPPQGVTVTPSTTASSSGSDGDQDGDTGAATAAAPSSVASLSSAATPGSSGGYVVQPGDTLSAIAARLGVSVSSLAAANGLTPSSLLLSGTTLHAAGTSAGAPATQTSAPTASSAAGGYRVQPGDTLSAIAARYGLSINQLASLNGLSPSGVLLSGTTLNVGGGSASAPASTEMVSTSPVASTGAQPTGVSVSPATVGSIAASEGVPPSLAEAIGYQESGFNNNMVSSTGATGVMQIMPGTWNYIGQNLAGPPPLSPTSATDNIRAGSLLLHSLLQQTGGDPAMAAAGYYQGLQSVRQNGLFPDTQAYVNNVMALRSRFGG